LRHNLVSQPNYEELSRQATYYVTIGLMTRNYWLGLTAITFLATVLCIVPIGLIALAAGIPSIFYVVEIMLGALTAFCAFKAYRTKQ
jgi:hypothetical protein